MFIILSIKLLARIGLNRIFVCSKQVDWFGHTFIMNCQVIDNKRICDMLMMEMSLFCGAQWGFDGVYPL